MKNKMGAIRNLRDTLVNFVTGLGTFKDPSRSSTYTLMLLNRDDLENAYRSDWLARKIVDAPAEDMTREWRSWQASDKQIECIEEIEQLHRYQFKLKQALIRARLYGGGALVIGVDDGQDSDQPVDIEAVQKDSLKFIVVMNRYELSAGPRIYNVNSPWYTRPEYYIVQTPLYGFFGEEEDIVPGRMTERALSQLNSPNVVPLHKPTEGDVNRQMTPISGMVKIHPSRVVEFAGNELPDWRLAPLGGGWGDSVLQTVDDMLRNWGMTIGGVASMVNDAKMDVIKIPDFSKSLSTKEYSAKLLQRFSLANQSKSTINSLLLDTDEEWERIQTNLSGTSQLIEMLLTITCGAGGIPVSRAVGNAPSKGLAGKGASGGEQDLRNYYDSIASDQKTNIRPRLELLDKILVRSALGKDDRHIHYDWTPLYLPDPTEEATIAFTKAQATNLDVQMGLINEDVLREARINQLIEDGTYPGLQDAVDEFGSEPEEPPPPLVPIDPKSGMPLKQPLPPPKMLSPPKQTTDAGFDPDQERDQSGKWSAGGAGGLSSEHRESGALNRRGASSSLGHGYSPNARLIDGVIHTDNVYDATRAIYQGRKVELRQPDQVSTLIQHLAEVSKKMIELEGKTPKFNLCNVSISGTNLFCAESKGIPRVKMPQLDDKQTKEFPKYLKSLGYDVDKTEVQASHLRATQDELDPVKTYKFAQHIIGGGEPNRLIVSRDNYILDGHHHWAGTLGAALMSGKPLSDPMMKVSRVDISITKLLEEAEKFTGGKGHKKLSDHKRDEKGRFIRK